MSTFLCIICSEEFMGTDYIVTTVCGHLYHVSCLSRWKARENTCPQCRKSAPLCIKLYTSVSQERPGAVANREVEARLNSALQRIAELEQQLKSSEANVMAIQAHYTECDEVNRALRQILHIKRKLVLVKTTATTDQISQSSCVIKKKRET